MSEEIKSAQADDVKKDDQKVEAETKQTEVADHETKAREMGWTPKEEFKGDPDKWVDAKDWVERAPLYDNKQNPFYGEMKKLRSKSRSLEKTVDELKQHYNRVEETAYQRAVETLKQQKLTALEEGDHKAVLQIDDRIDELKEQKRTAVQPPKLDPAFESWLEDNPWYDNDPRMRAYADEVGVRFANDHPDRPPQEVFEYAAERVQGRFADKFHNARREQPASVEGGRTSPAKPGKPRWSDMPEHFQKAGDKFVRQGIMTRDQYMADLVKIGELKT